MEIQVRKKSQSMNCLILDLQFRNLKTKKTRSHGMGKKKKLRMKKKISIFAQPLELTSISRRQQR